MKPTLAFAAIAACCLAAVAGDEAKKTTITVDVYYESLCPDSIRFITQELAPTYKDLKDFLSVNLIPFGKADWTVGNPTEFKCQHGPRECRGNRAQACALYVIEQTYQPQDRQQKMIDVVNCAMANRDPSTAVPKCAKDNGLSDESIERISNCDRTELGTELMIAYGDKTKAFESPISFVPSIVINGVKNTEANRNFREVICQMIPAAEKPAACSP